MSIIRTPIAELSFDDEKSILHMHILEGADMSMENTISHYNEIKKLTGDKKYAALIDAGNYYITYPETFAYSAKKSTFKNRVATIYYNLIVANKLTVDFFKKNYSPDMQLKSFKKKDEALAWWAEFKDRLLNED